MARAALPGRLTWRLGRVVESRPETDRCRTIILDVPDWPGHRAGQHVDIRLTAEDGYQAQRSYSIASAPEDDRLALTVERLDDGEVSPYLVDVLEAGDELELRGPVGGYFVWEATLPGPLLLVAGGSGIVPLHAMVWHWAAARRPVPARLLYSARSLDDVIYREELRRLQAAADLELQIALTREWPPDWRGHRGRVDHTLLQRAVWPADEDPRTFVCGPAGFVEAVAAALVESGQPAHGIRTERFGATGG